MDLLDFIIHEFLWYQSFELAKLKKENTQLKMVLDLLKKATVYFAKQMK